jgi:hypothetical protein
MRIDIVKLVVDATHHLQPHRGRSRTLSLGPSAMAEMRERMVKLPDEMDALGVEHKELCAELIKTGASLDLPEHTRCFLVKKIDEELDDLRKVMKEKRRQLMDDSTRSRAAAARKTIAREEPWVR